MEDTRKEEGLGFPIMVAAIIGSMIGTGVFNLSYNLGLDASPGAAIVAWIVCFVGTLVSVLSLKNLLEVDPEGDGLFCYARRSMGRFAEFMSAWGYWISGWIGNVAFATMMMIALGTFFPIFGDTGANWPSIIGASLVMWGLYAIVSRGAKSAMVFQSVITAIKLIPLAVFVIVTILSFRFEVFTTNFWTNFANNMGATGKGFDLLSVASQVNNSMLTLIWVFIGAESAALLSNQAKSKTEAGRATVVGLTLVTILEAIISLIPYGVMTAKEFTALGQPFLGQFLVLYIGPVGAAFIQAALVVSIFGAWISYTLMPTESITYLADENDLPKVFAKKNKYGIASFSLFITTMLCQVFLISMHWTEDAYNFGFSMSGSAILITWVFIDLYQIQFTLSHRDAPGATKNLVIGVIGLVYYLVCMFVSGINYVVVCFIMYVIGVPLYYKARKDAGDEHPFEGNQKYLLAATIALALVGVWLFVTGQV
ncbi:amino acid permease [Olsenella uli]|uniref:amino acid permease n=1 Tax=Olsenella uli TaxID=133926 RepID=UPI000453A767|nr:amino acid permease [Olsenella uli]EUB31471.1 transporter, basic amino acid/polyamine antiporter (APA) family [Olsenella uli MSTE5]